MNHLAVGIFLLASYGIPGLASLLTLVKWPASVTGVISLALSAAGGLLTEAAAQSDYDWLHGGELALASLAVALIAHKQLWEGDLAEGLHKIGFTGVSMSDLDVGLGYLEPVVEDYLDELTAPVSKPALPHAPEGTGEHPSPTPEPVSTPPAPEPVPDPLVFGTAAPLQTAARPSPKHAAEDE